MIRIHRDHDLIEQELRSKIADLMKENERLIEENKELTEKLAKTWINTPRCPICPMYRQIEYGPIINKIMEVWC